MCARKVSWPMRYAVFAAWLVCAHPRLAAAASAAPSIDAALAFDSECAAGASSDDCALKALQLRGRGFSGTGTVPDRPEGDADSAPERAEERPAFQEEEPPRHSQRQLALMTASCHTAVQGEACYEEVSWAKNTGVKEHPGWYKPLDQNSPFEDFQWRVHGNAPHKCPEPCSEEPHFVDPPRKRAQSHGDASALDQPLPWDVTGPVDPDACLCVFDIDRTLTAKQGSVQNVCPNATEVQGVEDNAYGGGILALSVLTANRLAGTFCDQCYVGVCSHGDAHSLYSEERNTLMNKLLHNGPMSKLKVKLTSLQWSDEPLLTPFVVYAPDSEKQHQVLRILSWYGRQGINIQKSRTHFFDDKANNVMPFRGTGMNAHQVSCGSRDWGHHNGAIGLCGAVPEEIKVKYGVFACPTCKWNQWLPWGTCSAKCDRTRHRTLAADNPPCIQEGLNTDVEPCTGGECPPPVNATTNETANTPGTSEGEPGGTEQTEETTEEAPAKTAEDGEAAEDDDEIEEEVFWAARDGAARAARPHAVLR